MVIVSEETGMVSVAYQGELYRDLETTEMRDLLQGIFRTGAGRDSSSETPCLRACGKRSHEGYAHEDSDEARRGMTALMDITTLESFARDLFFENSYYKLFSLVLVATLYVWVLGDRDAELSVFVPLRVGVPEGMVLINQPSDRVQVTIAGRWNSLQRFSQE